MADSGMGSDGTGISAASSIVGGVSQAILQAQAQGANQATIDQLQSMLAKINQPNFNAGMITPEEFKAVGTYNPQVQSYIAQKAPQLVTGQSAEAQQGADTRNTVLQRYADIAKTGSDAQSQQLQMDASKSAATQAAGTMGAVQNNMAARGLAGGGSELAMKLAAADSSNQANATSSQAVAQSSYQNRLQALSQQGMMGNQIRQEGLGIEGQNANTINSWNQQAQAGQQAVANANTNISNNAQMTNLNTAQGISNANTSAYNNARTSQQGVANNSAQTAFGDQMTGFNAQSKLAGVQQGQNNAVAQSQSDFAQGAADTAGTLAASASQNGTGSTNYGPTPTQNALNKATGYYTDENGINYSE